MYGLVWYGVLWDGGYWVSGIGFFLFGFDGIYFCSIDSLQDIYSTIYLIESLYSLPFVYFNVFLFPNKIKYISTISSQRGLGFALLLDIWIRCDATRRDYTLLEWGGMMVQCNVERSDRRGIVSALTSLCIGSGTGSGSGSECKGRK